MSQLDEIAARVRRHMAEVLEYERAAGDVHAATPGGITFDDDAEDRAVDVSSAKVAEAKVQRDAALLEYFNACEAIRAKVRRSIDASARSSS